MNIQCRKLNYITVSNNKEQLIKHISSTKYPNLYTISCALFNLDYCISYFSQERNKNIIKMNTLVISLLNSCIVAATSGAFIRLLTSFITSALFDRWPTVLAVAENRTNNRQFHFDVEQFLTIFVSRKTSTSSRCLTNKRSRKVQQNPKQEGNAC